MHGPDADAITEGPPETTMASPAGGSSQGTVQLPHTDTEKTPTVVLETPHQTTLKGVVTTVLAPTTLGGLLSTTVGQTTLDSVESTFIDRTTIDGTEKTLLRTTTLKNLVSSFSEVRTLDSVVTSVAHLVTLSGAVSIVGASYIPAKVVTLRDSRGVPTATSTITPPGILTPTVVTLVDQLGHPTATITTNVPVAPIVVTLTDSAGVATATLTEYPTVPSASAQPSLGSDSWHGTVHVYAISYDEYFVGFFLPTLVSVLLTIPIRMIDLHAKQFQPFHALTRRNGASGHSSLCLQTGGVYGIAATIRSLFGGQALVFLTSMLTLCSVFLVPLSSEAISIDLHGRCSATAFNGCAMTLGVSPVAARATMGLLGGMVLLIVAILVTLRTWQSGVATNPWSIAGVAALSTDPDVRAAICSVVTGPDGRVRQGQLVNAVGGSRFRLGSSRNEDGSLDYGIKMQDGPAPTVPEPVTRPGTKCRASPLPFITLSYLGRLGFLAFTSGLLILILYYNETFDDTPFEHFMDTQSVAVRFLFTLVGIGVTFYWASFFSSMAVLGPYHMLSGRPQPADRSVLLAPPINAFTGLWSAVRRRHWSLAVVGSTAILSEFMPILLHNVPMRITQTWLTHMVCTWLAVAILALMWLVVLGTFFLTWPRMPADPTTIAGAMYYVCDSPLLDQLEGLGALGKAERDERIKAMGLRFHFGNITGVSGAKRIAVDGHLDTPA